MDDDNYTWGFEKTIAQQLKASVSGNDREHPESHGRMTPCLYGKTKSGGITVGTPALVYVYDADGTLSTRELLAETRVSDITGDTEILLLSAYSRWLALELC